MNVFKALPLIALTTLVSACQNSGTPSQNLSLNTKSTPVSAISDIARAAQTCWFKSKDHAFTHLRMSSEVNSYAGRPRFLLVKRIDPNGLPMLVVQAEKKGNATSGNYTNIQTYGPMLQTGAGKRITDDVKRWSKGSKACS